MTPDILETMHAALDDAHDSLPAHALAAPENAMTPEQKANFKANMGKIFGFLLQNLPAILGLFGVAGLQTAPPPAGSSPPAGAQ